MGKRWQTNTASAERLKAKYGIEFQVIEVDKNQPGPLAPAITFYDQVLFENHAPTFDELESAINQLSRPL